MESLQTNRDDAKKINLTSNMGVAIDYKIQNMLSLTFILFIEYLINLEVDNLACFYSKRVRFERLGTEGLKWTANRRVQNKLWQPNRASHISATSVATSQ